MKKADAAVVNPSMSSAEPNHFTRLQLPVSPHIDKEALNSSYFALQRTYHPDHYTGAEKQKALQESMAINEAYNTLKDPLKRAEYLLLLHNIRVNTETGGVRPCPALLMEAMETRERLAETSGREALNALEKEAQTEKEQALTQFATYYSNGQLPEAAQETIRVKYLEKLIEEIKYRRMK